MNGPGATVHDGDRAPAIFAEGPAAPRRLGHVLWGTPDLEATQRFLVDVLGFRSATSGPGLHRLPAVLDRSPQRGLMQLAGAVLPSFVVAGRGTSTRSGTGHTTCCSRGGPDVHVWGLGRHFLGSNLFWYLRDPAGNFAEYYHDLDQIVRRRHVAGPDVGTRQVAVRVGSASPPRLRRTTRPRRDQGGAERMKIARFTESGRTRLGVVTGDHVRGCRWCRPGLPDDVGALLAIGGLSRVADLTASTPLIALADVVLEAPIGQPPTFLAIGLNYSAHVAESGMKKTDVPIVFNKQITCVTGPSGPIGVPRWRPTGSTTRVSSGS